MGATRADNRNRPVPDAGTGPFSHQHGVFSESVSGVDDFQRALCIDEFTIAVVADDVGGVDVDRWPFNSRYA